MSNKDVIDADMDYALRMVKTGYATPEQAAQTCGVPLATLKAKLASSAPAKATPQTAAILKARTRA